ncbi:MAG: hypothetical protein ACK41C_11665 [Phenylobacterium sp.]|jgi:hypothetical protein|uniref:hypothetical protein n=1 Tax=Phenylobacterium sp. TaxID=1871053 RepID=UPI003918E755
MRMITIAFAAAGFAAVGGSALAAVSDVEYLRANRCRGLAEGQLAQVDVEAMDAFLKAEGRTRSVMVQDRGKVEFDKAKREAKSTNEQRRARLTAELNGPCQVYKG